MPEAALIAWKFVSGGFVAILRLIADPTIRTVLLILLAAFLFLHGRDQSAKDKAADAAHQAAWSAAFSTEQGAFRREQGLLLAERAVRGLERSAAVSDATDTAKQCKAAVAETRRSDNAIHDLVNRLAATPQATGNLHDQTIPTATSPRLYGDDELCNAVGATCAR